MRYMGSANKFIFRLGVAAVFAIFIGLTVLDYSMDSADGIKQNFEAHLKNLASHGKSYDAIILGGSNSYYGLSAHIMSEELGLAVYNASLLREGFTDSGYNDFVRNYLGSHLEPRKIRLVIYSSVYPLEPGGIEEYLRANNRNIWGGVAAGIKTYKSIWGRRKKIAEYFFSGAGPINKSLLPDKDGDLIFSKATCAYLKEKAKYPKIDSADKSVAFYKHKYSVLNQTFPFARVVFVLPSEFYDEGALPPAAVEELKSAFARELGKSADLIIQPPMPSLNLVCDTMSHPNCEGRAWRTRDLAAALSSTKRF